MQNPANTNKSIKAYLGWFSSMGIDCLLKPEVNVLENPIPNTKPQDKSTEEPMISAKKPNSNTTSDITDLEELKQHIGDCQRCKLCQNRTHVVFGDGNPKAKLMFVGEGPGADEDKQGLPFVGRAGKLLTKMIEAMGLARSDVYIANVVKCRPPQNRNPEPDEIETCQPFLLQQIKIIQPKVIVTLGKFAAQTLLQTQIPISKLRGEFQKFHEIDLMPTYHPAFLLRNPNMKKPVWLDLQKVMKHLGLKTNASQE